MVKYRILTLGHLSPRGLERLPAQHYEIGEEIAQPDAILVRSQDMHSMRIPASLKAVARAGAGTNNIPIARLSARGVAVFNAPGANANAVKELVIASMLIAARNLISAHELVQNLENDAATMEQKVEAAKKQFSGFELPDSTLGIIGLGATGRLVADAALKLGMKVLGYDPLITVEAAWVLSSQVKKADSIEDLLRHSDFVTLHLPLREDTRELIDAGRIGAMKRGAILLNFARAGLVNEWAVVEGIAAKKLKAYVCDFPSPTLRNA
ncbi:MAG: 3-phosphoglycerate dehydrogenase, partial [Burkholderiales bacterium]